jgi:hypothetical protein
MSKIETLISDLQGFLSEKKPAIRTGFPRVEEKEMEVLKDLLRTIIELKYETDGDGDLPIEFVLNDRTRFRPFHVSPIPYSHKVDPEDLDTRLAILRSLVGQGLSLVEQAKIELDILRSDRV